MSDVDLIYNWAEDMLRADTYLPPPPRLAHRHFQRYLVDSVDQSECTVRPGSVRNLDEVDHGHTHRPGQADDHDHGDGHGHTHAHATWVDWSRIALVGVAAFVTWLKLWSPLASLDVIGLAAALAGGYPIYRHAVQDALRRRMTMELSMTIALASALAIGETLTALVIVFFVLIAEILEGMTVEQGRKSIQGLLDLLPDTVDLLAVEGVTTVPADRVRAGNIVLVRPGSRIPVDGEVRSGRKVTMVGDGINDGPALMEANVGIAMGSGTEVARESASIVLIGDDIGKVVNVLLIARHCRRIILTNFVGTLVVDVAGVALASFGFLNPIVAALIHVTSELLFIGNSARLLAGGGKRMSPPSTRFAWANLRRWNRPPPQALQETISL